MSFNLNGSPIPNELLVHFSQYVIANLVPFRHLYTNAKAKFIAAMARCFNARDRSSNPVPARKTFTTAPSKFMQR